MNLFLIGYRGTGKSTVARCLAEQLGWDAIDADELLESRAGCSIRDIFARQGEAAFRDLESKLLRELVAGERTVVALGGGAVVRPENREVLAGHGPIIWLQADSRTIWERISADPLTGQRRPNLTSTGGPAEIEELLAVRRPIYESVAQIVVDTVDRSPSQIAAEILRQLREREEGAWISG